MPSQTHSSILALKASLETGSVGISLFPWLTEEEVSTFEEKHSVRLPDEYRTFLTTIGNGGGDLFKLGEMDDCFNFKQWKENDGFVGVLADPFPYSEAWNDLTGYPEHDPERENDEQWLEEHDRQRELFNEKYFIPLNGAVPVAHLGCAIRLWLVITGPERGNIWHDDRANLEGMKPLLSSSGRRLSFLEWCKGWSNG